MIEKFGELLKKLRVGRKLTQEELLAELPAKFQNYDASEVSRWENGKRKPPEDVVEAFENVFSTAPGHLFEAAGYSKVARYRRMMARNHQVQALDIAARLRDSLSLIDPKYLGVYGLGHHFLGSTIISKPELRVWVERGQVRLNLVVEEDSRFPLFITQMKAEFTQFNNFDDWKESLAGLIAVCDYVRSEIRDSLEKETCMKVFGEVEISAGSLYEAWRFIYEFVLDNYLSENAPLLQVLLHDNRYHLVPRQHPEYVLLKGSEAEIQRCEKAIIALATRYAKSDKVGEIKARAIEVRKQAEPLQNALSILLGLPVGKN